MAMDPMAGEDAQQQQQPTPVRLFQKGDRVVCPRKPDNPNETPEHTQHMDACIGVPGTVDLYNSDDCQVIHDNGKRWWYRHEWLEPVLSIANATLAGTTPEPAPAPRKWRFRDFRC